MSAAKGTETSKYKRSDNVIPDFEHLFDEDAPPKNGKNAVRAFCTISGSCRKTRAVFV